MRLLRLSASRLLVALVCLAAAAPAMAHFPWLAVDDEGHALLFFGEHIADRTYHMPEKIKTAKVQLVDKEGKQHDVELKNVESAKYIGNRSAVKVADAGSLHCVAEYGIYAGTKLTYYTQHVLGKDAAAWPTKPATDVALQGILKKTDEGVELTVLWKGKPLKDAKVQLFCDEGHEEGSATTNPGGVVKFTSKEVEEGLNGLLVGYVDKDSPGELGGKKYTGESHYLTVTFVE
jgi:hypothetical protein